MSKSSASNVYGYSVDVARSGVDGLHMALEQDYELAILDVMLPGLDGWEVMRRLRVTRDLPVLFLSARDEVNDLKVDVLRRKVSRREVEIPLTNKEFMLRHLLAKRQGEVLSRARIASEVWDMNFDSDTNVVDVAIKRLRAKIDAPFEKKADLPVRSVGYTLSIGS